MHRLLLVRHGETAWNVEGRFQGHTDVPLSEVGRAQARALRDRLAARVDSLHLFDARRTVVLSSDLARARETAELAFPAADRALHLAPGLREIHFGEFEGLTAEEIDARHPGVLGAWLHGDPDLEVPGCESRRATGARAVAALSAFLERHQASEGTDAMGRCGVSPDVIVVTHGGVLRQLLGRCFPIRAVSVRGAASCCTFAGISASFIEGAFAATTLSRRASAEGASGAGSPGSVAASTGAAAATVTMRAGAGGAGFAIIEPATTSTASARRVETHPATGMPPARAGAVGQSHETGAMQGAAEARAGASSRVLAHSPHLGMRAIVSSPSAE